MALKDNDTLDNKKDHKGLKLDAKDIENIENALKIYEKMNPPGMTKVASFPNPKTGKEEEWIEYCNINDHLNYMRSIIDNKAARVAKFGGNEPIRIKVSVPPSLEAWLNRAYPLLFTDEVQTDAFLRAFPRFNLTKD